ncbi:hypothetical protein [Thermus caldilimi]|nr:hypothetical protein [Thermus caldilimi]
MTGVEMDYWTKWALALAYPLAFLLFASSLAEFWAWLDERERRGR